MIQILPGISIFYALLLIILPLDWLISVLVAAVTHEIYHIMLVYLLNGHILRIDVRIMGCTIEAVGLGEWRQFVSILAGPLGSFSLLILYRIAPKLAICGFLQGIYNLLPFYHLDGGRLLLILLHSLLPKYADTVMYFISVSFCIFLDLIVIYVTIFSSVGLWLIIAAIIWNVRMLPRKIPCKPGRIGVQ